ncbi:hypothetical protein MRB53_030036 [Persea americana]|uniref:Uncharacterized protein n=1 Tax=Persea americana TaxID=3435 RepID=A0ACC2KK63_PERAE|nr:hypothetical protein MRB53_030036 [Persea americana]
MEILGREGRRSRLRISSMILPPKTTRRVWGSGRRAHAEFYYKRQRQMDWALEILQLTKSSQTTITNTLIKSHPHPTSSRRRTRRLIDHFKISNPTRHFVCCSC